MKKAFLNKEGSYVLYEGPDGVDVPEEYAQLEEVDIDEASKNIKELLEKHEGKRNDKTDLEKPIKQGK